MEGEGAAEAVATVACVLIAAGPLLANSIRAGAGVDDNGLVVVGHRCRRARRARFLAGFDRSILIVGGSGDTKRGV